MSKALNNLLKVLNERKERFSKSQTEIYNKSKKEKNNVNISLMQGQVDVLRIRIEEIENIAGIIEEELNNSQTKLKVN